MRNFMLITAVTLGGLTGCFNGSDDRQTGTQPTQPAQPDSFIVEVQRQVNVPVDAAETLEAIQVSNVMETSPETDEPIAVMF